MGYLSKASLLRVYEALSELTNDPSAQGATQVTSALRYLFALDEFTKAYERSCDTSRKDDRESFITYVGNVVAINNELYTANFFNSIKNNPDYAVGSNFFSVNTVKNSTVDPNTSFPFPKRGHNPLFYIKGGKLIEEPNLLKNLKEYLHTPDLQNAFAVWLIRFESLDKNDIFKSLVKALQKRYSHELISQLDLNEQIIVQYIGEGLIDNPYSLSITDFPFSPSSGKKESVILSTGTPVNVSYSIEDLSDYLKDMHGKLGTVGIHLFGIKYGGSLSEINLKELCRLAQIPESYVVEINKMRNLYGAIKDHKYGVWFYEDVNFNLKEKIDSAQHLTDTSKGYLRAMRTKPFLLLAGISGTGKSRLVKEMAFDSCPDNPELRKDPTSPGNYCLIEVKPNWHDSTELLGYESRINGPEYVATPFIKFLAKAMLHEDTPFFVCLDEMNLAPVEQYFAEFLSVLESRKRVGNAITSEPLIKASVFRDHEAQLKPLLFGITQKGESYEALSTIDEPAHYGKENAAYDLLKEQGLRIPPNVVVVGTVNMDETTHQFSRKVIDRAMTIEMNLPEDDPFTQFYDSREPGYRDAPHAASLYLPTKVSASEALKELAENDAEKTDWLKREIVKVLSGLNAALEDTPFKVAYRVQNELVLYFYEVWRENQDADWADILSDAFDQILMMKVLPRVEGDEDLLENPLGRLADFCAPYPNATKKIQEMKTRLDHVHFTSYWP